MLHEPVSKKEAMKRVRELLKMVGIDPSRANNYPFEFRYTDNVSRSYLLKRFKSLIPT